MANNEENKKNGSEMPPPPPPKKDNDGKQPSPPFGRVVFSWALTLGMLAFMIYAFMNGGHKTKELSGESVFRRLLSEQKIEKCEFVRENSGKTYVRGVRKGQENDGSDIPKEFTLSIMPDRASELQELMSASGIDSTIHYANPFWGDLMAQLIPVIVFLALIYFIFTRQMRGGMGAMNFGKNRARKLDTESNKLTFKDVAGAEEAKDEVQEIIEFLKDPKKFARLGGRIPKGVLLMGPPGTGKTLLAKAIAGESNVPFFSISGSDFVEMFVGVGASRVRDMFEQAKKNAPCIIFIDEIDAVGRSRFTGIGGGHDEREQTLNAMLVEMDGFETSSGVIVMAATNRPDVLDKALLRPGRFDRQIVIDLPTMEGRLAILKIHAAKIKLADGVELDRVARGTPGFSGADLANLVNEAALHAAKLNKSAVEQADFEEARDKVCWGRERPGQMKDESEKRLTAFHEAGHAIVMSYVKGGEPIHKVTIIPRGMALGATMFLPKKDRLHYSKTEMLANLAVSMGGRVAEEIFLDDISAGASQDLRQATELAHRMICDWGMSDKLGPRTFGAREEMMFLGREVGRSQDYSEATAQLIDREVDGFIKNAYKQAHEILSEHADKVNTLVDALLEYETVDGADVESIIKDGHILPRALKEEPKSESPDSTVVTESEKAQQEQCECASKEEPKSELPDSTVVTES